MNFLDPKETNTIKKPDSDNNAVVFVTDCSIGDSAFIVYELQTVQASLLTNRNGRYSVNDEMNWSLAHSELQKNHGVYLLSHNDHEVIVHPEGEGVYPWFLSAEEGQSAPKLEENLKGIEEVYFCIYTSLQQNTFLNKSYQILFFTKHCPELFPFSRIYSRDLEIEEVISDVKKSFLNKESKEIVIKAPFTANGRGNRFGLTVESSKEKFEEAVKAVLEASDNHLFPLLSSIERKLGITEFEFLKGFNTYRLLVFASKDGKYFHVTPIRKYQSQTVDSHQFTKERNYSEKKKKIDFSPSVYEQIRALTRAVFEYDKIITEKNPKELDEYLKKLNEYNKTQKEKPLKISLKKPFFELIDNDNCTFDEFLSLFFKSSSKDPSFIEFFSNFVLSDPAILQADLLEVLFKYLSKEALKSFIDSCNGAASLLAKKALNKITLRKLIKLELIDTVSLMKNAETKELISAIILKDLYSLGTFFSDLPSSIITEVIKNLDFTGLKFTDHSFRVLFSHFPVECRQCLIEAIGASRILADLKKEKNIYYINGSLSLKESWELVISISQKEKNESLAQQQNRTPPVSFFLQQKIESNANEKEVVVLKKTYQISPHP